MEELALGEKVLDRRKNFTGIELLVTSKRLICEEGLLQKSSAEIPLEQISSTKIKRQAAILYLGIGLTVIGLIFKAINDPFGFISGIGGYIFDFGLLALTVGAILYAIGYGTIIFSASDGTTKISFKTRYPEVIKQNVLNAKSLGVTLTESVGTQTVITETEIVYCDHCGFKNRASAQFCKQCGGKL